jgi:hypothetical protein
MFRILRLIRNLHCGTRSATVTRRATTSGSRSRRKPLSSLASAAWMRQGRVLWAICLIVWSPLAASQTTAPAALSGTLRDHLKNERFEIVTSITGFPLGVRDGLQALFGSQRLDIADPGARLQATEAIGNSTLPLRRLIAGGCSRDHHCLVYYERGGGTRTWRVALFHWSPAATRFEWGGNARGGLATIDDVRNAVLAGAVKGPATSW